VPYPDKVLTDGEEVVASLHPHALSVFWPVVRLLLVVGAASFGMAMIPVGRNQGVFRLALLVAALLLLLVTVVRPLMRWRTTQYVITTHRLLYRTGVLARSGRDIALSRITDVTFRQTLWERVIRSGTLTVTSAGEGVTVLHRVPGSERVQTLLNHMIEEDADRRAQESGGHGHATGGWGSGAWGTGAWGSGAWDSDDLGGGRDTGGRRTAVFRTDRAY
jgi:uncharacterized membrane protein YdbT with pleckstrin-like domain